MDMSHGSFDPTDVRARINPAFPPEPLRIDAGRYVGQTVYLDPRRVRPMEGQPRTEFRRIKRLATGIKGFGQNTPIRVHPIESPDYDAELQAGERRTKACIEAKLMIRAEVREAPTDRSTHFVDSFVENFNREPLTTLETVECIRKLLADGHSRGDIADMSGKTYGWVVQFASLTTLHSEVLPYLDERKEEQRSSTGRKLRRVTALPLTVALQVAKMPQEEQLSFVLATIAEARSISEVRRMVERRLHEIGAANGIRKRSSNERFDTLGRQVVSFAGALGRYLDMSSSELRSLFEDQEQRERIALAESMREVSMHLKGVAQIVWPKSIGGNGSEK